MLLNREGKVFVGLRIDNRDEAWQMPQGGSTRAKSRGPRRCASWKRKPAFARSWSSGSPQCPERLKYRLPDELVGVVWKEPWIGQDQDWYLARFLGQDGDVDIATSDPEFRDWKWIDPAALPDAIVPFKRDLYRRLLANSPDYL